MATDPTPRLAARAAAAVADAVKPGATVREKAAAWASRTRDMIAGTNLPDVAVKLARTYAFKRSRSGQLLTVVAESPLEDTFFHPMLSNWAQRPTRVALTSKHHLDLPPGVTIVLGRAGTGKSALTLGRMTLGEGNEHVCYIRHGEPVDPFFLAASPIVAPSTTDEAANGVYLSLTEPWLAHKLSQLLLDGPAAGIEVVIIDSLRYLVFGASGATGKGGVNLSLFTDLSALDVAAAAAGLAVVVVVNPMTDDPAGYEFMREAAVGSVAAVIDMKSPTEFSMTSRYTERRWRTYNLPALTAADSAAAQGSAKITPRTADLSELAR